MAGFDVVIPAGGRIDEEFAKVAGTPCKPLIKFNDKTVLRHTIEALQASGRVGRIVVVGSPEVCKHDDAQLADACLPEEGTSPKNIWAGATYLQGLDFPPDRILIVTSDLPYLAPGSVQGFLDICDQAIDFNVSLIARDDYEEAFPGATATFVKLLDGEWTTGGMFLITIRGLKVALDHMERVFKVRKSKLGMAKLLGLKFVWDYKLKKLTVSSVEQKVMELLRVRGRAVPGSPPELAFDIDDVDDYHYVLSSLKARQVGIETDAPKSTPVS